MSPSILLNIEEPAAGNRKTKVYLLLHDFHLLTGQRKIGKANRNEQIRMTVVKC